MLCRMGLLIDTADSITQVALAFGFNHLSYYSKLFLRSYGCTPSQFRNIHLQ
ncbi:helix-turn-helix domain-containing protein [Lacrimispora sp.]|uniref:helix-turn-helix domain-containing protein n=1 Tax=Lacrimispora sp. TaxID=2719234 RepID=UPI0028B054EB|nr:helix-turn-helix domain-containing protein [Lacrimispora sp.]